MRTNTQTVPVTKVLPSLFGDNLKDEDFLSDLDKAFDRIQILPKEAPTKKGKARGKKTEKGLAHMKTTFVEISRVHLRPVLRYLKAIHLGIPSKELCEIVHYVVGPIIGKTRKVGLIDQTKALIGFQRCLKEVVKNSAKKLTAEQSAKLSKSFDPVQKSFELDYRGHATAVVNLLGYYKALRKNSKFSEDNIKKLFAIGIPSLTMLRKSSIAELVSLSGIHPNEVALLRNQARNFTLLSIV